MANRMILISHFAVTAIETNQKLKILNFDEYMDLFDLSELQNQRLIQLKKKSFFDKLIISLIYRFFKNSRFVAFIDLHNDINGHKTEFDLKSFVQKNSRKCIIPEGWGFRNHEGLKKHPDLVRSFFRPTTQTIERLNEFTKDEGTVLIGLHIRRGDYKEYLDGAFYFTDEEYLELIRHIKYLFKSYDFKIILLSNESLNSIFLEEDRVMPGPGQFIDDFFLLTKCHYIIGPPSTFSLVASFLGDNKYYHITKSNQRPVLADFKSSDSV